MEKVYSFFFPLPFVVIVFLHFLAEPRGYIHIQLLLLEVICSLLSELTVYVQNNLEFLSLVMHIYLEIFFQNFSLIIRVGILLTLYKLL